MRTVIQRVAKASVSVGDELVSSIGKGLCVLVGISRDDTKKDMEYMVKKVLNLRVWDNDEGKRWSCSAKDKDYEILCVSQFTLYTVMKGNKPDYHQAMAAEQSKLFYEEFLQQLRKAYGKPNMIKDGAFGAHMQVNIQNDGPVTITLESPPLSDGEKAKLAKTQKRDKPQASAPSPAENTPSEAKAPESSSLAKETEDKLNIS